MNRASSHSPGSGDPKQLVRVQARTNKWLAVSGKAHINLAMNLSIITIYLLCPFWRLSCKISGRSLPQTDGIDFRKEFREGLSM